MIDWPSQTYDIAIVSLENSGTGGSEVVDGAPLFKADLYVGMKDDAEVVKYFDAIQAYLPAANTIRMPINAKSLDQTVEGSNVVGKALHEAAERGYQIILVYTDPIFHGDNRKPFNATYYDNNVSVVNGKPIERDGNNHADILKWGSQSAEYDPMDNLSAGWGSVLDWLDVNPDVKSKVYGYELVNEPGRVFTNANNADQANVYAVGMTEVYKAHAGRWTNDLNGDGTADNAKILVDIMGGGSGRVGALDQAPRGSSVSSLDLIRQTIGENLVWSIHTFTDMSVAEFSDEGSFTKIHKLASDNILVTETQFDGDFQLLGTKTAEGKELAARYGVIDANDPKVADKNYALAMADFYDAKGHSKVATWMGWELLDPIMGSRNYTGAREKEWYADHGIGSAFWTPVGFDASMFPGYPGRNIEVHRDITAFANAMWAPGLTEAASTIAAVHADGSGVVSIAATASNAQSGSLPPMAGFAFGGANQIIGADTPETEGGVRDFRQGGRQQVAGQVELADKFRSNGDMAYGGAGADHFDLRGGDDYAFGFNGNDTIDGGSGHDILLGGKGDDSLIGGAGDDVLEGQDGNDTISGGAGTDLIKGDRGDDLLNGGEGVDYFYFDAAGDGKDTITGFEWGIDRIFIGDSKTFFGKGDRHVIEVDTSQPIQEYAYGPGAIIYFQDAAH